MDIDREADGHGQLLGTTSKALSQNVLFYFRLRRSLRELRWPGTILFLSYQPLYSELPHNALSLLCPLSTLESPLGRLLRLGPRTVCKPGVFGRNGPRCGIKRDTGVFVTTCAPDFTRARHFFRLSARSDLSPLPTHIPQALHTVQGAQ